jgi:hypothetical protein
MRELPLTDKQVEICDFILRNNGIEDTYEKLEDDGHSDRDNRIASKFLIDNGLITIIHPVVLTDLGSKYSKTSIVVFIRHKRRDDFLNSPVFKTVAIWIPIFISLVFNVSNCSRTNHIQNEDIFNKKQYRDIDSTVKEIVKKIDKRTINESTIDTTKHIDKDFKINK